MREFPHCGSPSAAMCATTSRPLGALLLAASRLDVDNSALGTRLNLGFNSIPQPVLKSHQLFKDIFKLQKFLGLRSAYMLNILSEACKINSFKLCCGQDGSADPDDKASLMKLLKRLMTCHPVLSFEVSETSSASDEAKSQNHVLGKQLLFFDLAQSTHPWTTSRVDFLTDLTLNKSD